MSDNFPPDSSAPAESRPRTATITGSARRSSASPWRRFASSARRWRIFFRFVFFGVIAAIVWGVFNFSGDRVAKAGKHTALIDLQGEISTNGDASAENIDGALEAAFEDDGTQIHGQFIDAVKQGRGSRLKDDSDLFSGEFWTGEKSVDLGLADGFGNASYVAREIIKQPDIVDYTQKESISERVVKRFGASIGDAAVRALTLGDKAYIR
ncbi:Periplasmic serine protease (ClpP class) [Candidatus Paraburkholderia calva]|nr:Periplasmic serine protease (ClpP class) [Candidatus Paraburkholderia calva]